MAGMKRGKERGKQRVLAREKSQNTKNSEISDAASISVKIEVINIRIIYYNLLSFRNAHKTWFIRNNFRFCFRFQELCQE